jgi:virulence factor Mce-like protein
MKRVLSGLAMVLVLGAVVLLLVTSSSSGSSDPTYKLELDNAFGLVNGASFKVAGVTAGTITSIDLDQKTLHAVVTINVTQAGFGSFHSDAFCQSRPQSLIGEYFISCDPGHTGKALKPGSTIPVDHTQSTIPADLLQNVLRMPYRERLSLIINELGAAVAGRSGDLQAALRRAVPALTETDNLLNLLGNDSHTLQQLTVNSDSVITALANNSAQVQRFIVEANNAASDTATQQANLSSTLQRLPGFLEQLRPALQRLGAATDANQPVLANLNSSATQINRLFTDLPGFSRAARPAIKSLGQASVTGKAALQASGPTIRDLNRFAKPTPELGQNLAIVLRDLDNRGRAVETNPRSPGGKGYTGLEALLQFAFNLAAATNTYGPFGHQLAVDAFVSVMCTPYATPGTIATNLKVFGPRYRSCYAQLGPNQAGVNVADPSSPGTCVPDPGGVTTGQTGLPTTACKLPAADLSGSSSQALATSVRRTTGGSTTAAGQAAGTGGTAGGSTSGSGPPGTSSAPAAPAAAAAPAGSATGGEIGKLLNYLLSP